MPPKVLVDKCNGCGSCNEVCPGDLMTLINCKAVCRDLRDCWDCMACTKACPRGAIETRIPYQIGYHPAKLIPTMSDKSIDWTCVDIHGKVERFIVKTHNDGD